jgi:HEAT repeat protein
MPDHSHHRIEELLASVHVDDLHEGLRLVKQEISRLGSDEARELFEIVSTLFYFDPIERPDLVPILEEAISLVVGFGKWVIPALIQKLDAGDFKAQLAIASALGRIGADAIAPLMNEFRKAQDPDCQVFILYALGKIKSPRIVEALPLVLESARSPHRELRDTAVRAIGKLAESIPPAALPEPLRRAAFEQLQKEQGDPNAGIRAKAIRSLGKLAKHGHLRAAEQNLFRTVCDRVLGKDGHFEWDRAYVVRREAEEALHYVQPNAES